MVSLPSFFVPEGPYSAESTTVCQNIFCGDDEGGVYFSPPRPQNVFFLPRPQNVENHSPSNAFLFSGHTSLPPAYISLTLTVGKPQCRASRRSLPGADTLAGFFSPK